MKWSASSLVGSAVLATGLLAGEAARPTPTPTPLPNGGLALPAAPQVQATLIEDAPALGATPSIDLPNRSDTATGETTRSEFQAASLPELKRPNVGYAPLANPATPARSTPASESLQPAEETTSSRSPSAGLASPAAPTTQSSLAPAPETQSALALFEGTTVRVMSASLARQEISPNGTGKQGVLNFNRGLNLEAGGVYYFDFVGTGTIASTDLVKTTELTFSATQDNPFIIALGSYNSQGALAALTQRQFDPRFSYRWDLISADKITGFSPFNITVDTTQFGNNLNGGLFYVDQVGNRLVLEFTPVPEPSTWALIATGALALGWTRLRRRTS